MKYRFVLPIIALGMIAAPGLGVSVASAGTLSSPAAAPMTRATVLDITKEQVTEVRKRRRHWRHRYWRHRPYYYRHYRRAPYHCHWRWRYGHRVRWCHRAWH